MQAAIFSFLLMLLVCIFIALLVNIKNSYIKFTIYLIIILLFIYFHPSQEIMTCNINYSCHIEREYLKVFNIKKDFNLSSEARLKCDIYNIPLWFKSANIKDNYYIKINIIDKNKKYTPFVYYVDIQKSNKLADSYAESLASNFVQYTLVPEKYFNLESKANSAYFYLLIFLIVLFLLLFRRVKC